MLYTEPMSRICKCTICEIEELTMQTLLPQGWAILWDHPATVCSECLKAWEEKWGAPVLWLKGEDKELTLFEELSDEYGSIS